MAPGALENHQIDLGLNAKGALMQLERWVTRGETRGRMGERDGAQEGEDEDEIKGD